MVGGPHTLLRFPGKTEVGMGKKMQKAKPKKEAELAV